MSFRRTLSRLCLAACLAVSIPASSQTPLVPPGFPFPGPGGIFGGLLDEPHVVEVRRVSSDGGSFSITMSRGEGAEMTFSQTGSAANSASKLVARLQVGRRYLFPHCVIDLLGLDQAIWLFRMQNGQTLASLSSSKPFRAVVLDQGISEPGYSIIIQEAGGRIHHLRGRFDEHPDARAIAMFLSRGRSVEFPSVLEDALLTKEKRAERAKPKNEATSVLYRYLGEWRGGIEGNPKAKVEMVCHARPDGSGIWREITFSDGSSEVPSLPDINIVEYDRSEQGYLAGSLADGSPPPLRSTWDEATRTFTTILPADDSGLKRINKATFTREDRIDWKTTTQEAGGQIISTSAGYYDRVRGPQTEAEPLPPTTLSESLPWAAPFQPLSGPAFVITLGRLQSCQPFRAKVASVEVKRDEATIQLLDTNGAYQTLLEKSSGIGESPLGKALSALKIGEVHEFPFCIQNPGKAPVGKPATPEMKALEPFIGTWKAYFKAPDGSFQTRDSTCRMFWSADGTFIWREDTFRSVNPTTGKPDEGPAKKRLGRILYDSGAACYVEAEEHDVPSVKEHPATWDAAKKVYSWRVDTTNPIPRKIAGMRRFVSDDRIDYEVRHTLNQSDQVREDSGYYERIKE